VVLDQFKAVNKRDFDRWRHLILGYGLRASHRRVTTVFRREDGTWKVTHRHGDPITTSGR
jgi:hypothetical protein